LEPLIVNVKPAVPAAALDGDTDWIAGTGFGGGGGGELEPPHEDNKKERRQGKPPGTDLRVTLRSFIVYHFPG
jgi:hypothetical protein